MAKVTDGAEGRIGKNGPLKGNTKAAHGPNFSHLPSRESYDNGGVKRKSVGPTEGQNTINQKDTGSKMAKNGPTWAHLPNKPE